jgi:potassium efflux system protein
LFVAVLGLFASHGALAQVPGLPTSDGSASDGVAAERAQLEERKKELQARIAEWTETAEEFLETGRQANARIARIDRELELLEKRQEIEILDGLSIVELDAQLLAAERELAAARAEARELDAQVGARTERRRRLPELLALARQRLTDLNEVPPAEADDPSLQPLLADIERLRREALQAEIDAYGAELSSYDVRGTLLSKRRDRATLRISYYEELARRLREEEQRLERIEVEEAAESTARLLDALTAIPPGVRETLEDLNERNEALASVWTSDGGLSDQIRDVSEKLARAERHVAEVQTELTRLAARVEAVGLADSVGALLRRHRAEAPDIGMYKRFIRMRQEQIGSVQLQQIRLREQREALADIDALVDEVMESIAEPISEDEEERLRRLLRKLFETQRRYMDALIEQYETYFQKLVDFDAQQQALIDSTKDLLDFIDERILWIPSGRAIQANLISDGGDAIAWLTGPKFVAQLWTGIRDMVGRAWLLHLLALLLLALFVPFARRAPGRLRELSEEARSNQCVRFGPTAEAVGVSAVLALAMPALLAYFGWRLGQSPAATQYTRCVAFGLQIAAALWASIRVPRELAREHGVLRDHCNWPADVTRALWRDLRWLGWVAVPATFLIFVFEMRGEDAWMESVGRAFFVVAMGAVAVFNVRAVRNGGWLAVLSSSDGRYRWSRRLIRLGAIVLPFLLILAALRGFYWTSLQFTTRIHFTLLSLFLLTVGMYLAARLAMLGDRRAQNETDGLEQKPATPAPAPTMTITRLMVGTGLLLAILAVFAIWADMLPAARILDNVELWRTTQTVSVTELDPSGVERTTNETRSVPITLTDLFRFLLLGLLTLALVRALPALLEATLFRRLGPGERYAYVTIVKYAVILAGLALAFDAIGVGWSSIQWLVAAIGLGLGFGLQEIFANFISGLIILFERPIRVGDTVSVGGVDGVVSKIRIRATWITGFDRKELIVPNKEFVTGQLINWTLSDPLLRLDIVVGIAYGSDTEKAVEVLKGVARDSLMVLHDPPPQVWFLEFGDSSLSFELRVFTRGVERRFKARHELHMNIDKAFREAGIEIAFPQRDLHVRSLPAEWRTPAEKP